MSTENLRLSWTGLKRYEDCHQRHLRVLEGKAPKSTNGRVFLAGTVCDRAMRKWLDSSNPQPGEMAQYVDEFLNFFAEEDPQYVIKWRGDPRQDRAKVRDFCLDLVGNLEPLLYQKVLPFRYQPAVKFRVPVNIPDINGESRQISLVGEIDIVVLDDDDNYSVLDLKATSDDSYVRRGILGQLTFYSLAWGQYVGKREQPTEAYFVVPAAKQKLVPVSVGTQERVMMLSRIVHYAHGVWRKEWQPSPGDQCGRCEVKHSCDHFRPILSQDDAGRRRASFLDLAESRRAVRNGRDREAPVVG